MVCRPHPQIYDYELADSLIEYIDRTAATRPVYLVHVEQKDGKDIFAVEEVMDLAAQDASLLESEEDEDSNEGFES